MEFLSIMKFLGTMEILSMDYYIPSASVMLSMAKTERAMIPLIVFFLVL